MAEYADVETRLAPWLHEQVGHKVWADPGIPDNWPFTAPLITVRRGPGEGDTALTLDSALLDIDVYAKVADHARQVAEQVRSAMRLVLPQHTWDDGVTVSGSFTVTGPFWAPDPSLLRRSATYRVILHGLI